MDITSLEINISRILILAHAAYEIIFESAARLRLEEVSNIFQLKPESSVLVLHFLQLILHFLKFEGVLVFNYLQLLKFEGVLIPVNFVRLAKFNAKLFESASRYRLSEGAG